MHREPSQPFTVCADDRFAELVAQPVIDMSTDGRYVELLQRCVGEEIQDVSLPVRE